MLHDSSLEEKYNKPVPRYTSYPTVPFWNKNISRARWQDNFQSQFTTANSNDGISLYLHLPFCESLCTYCGCNKKITTNHGEETEYLDAVLKEWNLYRKLMSETPLIRELHIGGGTPTFFSPDHIARLVNTILQSTVIHPEYAFSIEGHPNNTSRAHLETLYALGFRRISYGVQDHDPHVQQIINRIQPLENVELATDWAREAGFESINYDLIYGLPLQHRETMQTTIMQTLRLKPDRIAFYSYAHVPWVSKSQRLFSESDIPLPAEKLEMYKLGKKLYSENGYTDIGMDHFALPSDELYKSWKKGTLHRNFMGYTTQKTSMLLGLGVSAISDSANAYAQNEKALQNYYRLINSGELAIQKGYFLDNEDISFRKYILDISCTGKTILNHDDLSVINQFCFPYLHDLELDGLVVTDRETITVTETGRNFIRNVCHAFDLHMHREKNNKTKSLFSNAI